jgi:hypothetical protein
MWDRERDFDSYRVDWVPRVLWKSMNCQLLKTLERFCEKYLEVDSMGLCLERSKTILMKSLSLWYCHYVSVNINIKFQYQHRFCYRNVFQMFDLKKGTCSKIQERFSSFCFWVLLCCSCSSSVKRSMINWSKKFCSPFWWTRVM